MPNDAPEGVDNDETIKDGPLSPSERRRVRYLLRQSMLTPLDKARLRRLLERDEHTRLIAEHRNATVKVWLIWIGSVSAIAVSVKTLLWDFVKGFLK